MSTLNNVTLILSRLLLGTILIAHGWQKFTDWGLDGTAETFAGMGVPAPGFSALVAATVELVGGALILLGVATRWVGIVVALQMFGAFLFAHMGKGLFVADGGFELAGATAAAALALAGAGAGTYSIDRAIARNRTRD